MSVRRHERLTLWKLLTVPPCQPDNVDVAFERYLPSDTMGVCVTSGDRVSFYEFGAKWKSRQIPLSMLQDARLVLEVVNTYDPDIVTPTGCVWTIPVFEPDFKKAFPYILKMLKSYRKLIEISSVLLNFTTPNTVYDLWPESLSKNWTIDTIVSIMSACEWLLYDPGFVYTWSLFHHAMHYHPLSSTPVSTVLWHKMGITDHVMAAFNGAPIPLLTLLAGLFSEVRFNETHSMVPFHDKLRQVVQTVFWEPCYYVGNQGPLPCRRLLFKWDRLHRESLMCQQDLRVVHDAWSEFEAKALQRIDAMEALAYEKISNWSANDARKRDEFRKIRSFISTLRDLIRQFVDKYKGWNASDPLRIRRQVMLYQ